MPPPDADDRFRAIVESQAEFISLARSDGTLVYVNPSCARQFGRAPAELIGSNLFDFVAPADREAVRQQLDELLRDGQPRREPWMQRAFAGETVEFTVDYPGAEGTTYLALGCVRLRLEGVVDGFVGISRDITRQRREELRLTHLAQRDSLAGLLNRAGFEQEIDRLVRQGEGPQRRVRPHRHRRQAGVTE